MPFTEKSEVIPPQLDMCNSANRIYVIRSVGLLGVVLLLASIGVGTKQPVEDDISLEQFDA